MFGEYLGRILMRKIFLRSLSKGKKECIFVMKERVALLKIPNGIHCWDLSNENVTQKNNVLIRFYDQ